LTGCERVACGETAGTLRTSAAAKEFPDQFDKRSRLPVWAPTQARSGFIALPSPVPKSGAGLHCIGEDEHLNGFA
jgi:hypothetical protein